MYAVSFSYLTQFSAVSLIYAFSVTAPVTVNFKKCAIMHENVRFSDENSKKNLERGPPPHTPLPLRLRSLEPPLLNCFRCPWSFPGLQRVGIGNLAEATCPTSQGIPSSRVGLAVYLAPRYIVTEMKLSASELELELELITCSFLNVLSTSESPEVHKHSDLWERRRGAHFLPTYPMYN